MPRLPRDLSGEDLVRKLKTFGYEATRQTGSHIRVTRKTETDEHVTVPKHKALRLGTLNDILNDVASHLKKTKDELSKEYIRVMIDLAPLTTALQERMLAVLPQHHENPDLAAFYNLIRDYPSRQGKNLRGLFILLSCEAHGGRWQDALDVAVALELFQNWVLIHDDIEDDSEERRGTPALHKQVGMPVALNVGDALHVYMWQVLNQEVITSTIRQEFLEMIHRTAEGQHLDLSWIAQNRFDVSEAEYMEMVTLKTAHYTVVSPLRLGAFCACAVPDERLIEAGKDLGVAFQIRDDVLNLSESEGYGKEFAGDIYEAKRTLILSHLFAQVETEEKAQLVQCLTKVRQDKTDEDIQRVLKAIKKYGSLAYAQSVAESKAKSGLEVIKEIGKTLANQRLTQGLTGLLESLAARHK
jgi:geranylgeranyl diphosphate synthase, type II